MVELLYSVTVLTFACKSQTLPPPINDETYAYIGRKRMTTTLCDASTWLGETAQLDVSDAKLRITAQKLTQSKQSHAARAAAIQDFVRRMPFAASADRSAVRASQVLRAGGGDCHSKGVLFTALCRAAELPARLLFVNVRPRFLTGILSGGPTSMLHAVGQVQVDNRWHSTDGYVVDPILFARAKQLLRAAGSDCGWGIVANASGYWNGQTDCLQQFHPQDVLETYGVFNDPAEFYRTRRDRPEQGWLLALKYELGARMVNLRVAQARHAAHSS